MPPKKGDSLIGMMILDQYYLVEVLGKGGMSEVYLAEQASMDRYAAIKILRARRAISEEASRRFRQEARAISRLSHQHIVTVYNFGELADGSLFLAMEYVEGISLDRFLKRHAPLPLMRAINLVFQAAGALGYAHTKNIIHRDFKPENVMVAKQLGRDHIKVLDFGIARLLDDSYASQPGSIVGTPQYLSPEQCRGEVASPFSDQYALGLVFYEMLTGQLAIAADTLINYIHMHQYATPKPPSQLRSDQLMELLDPIVLRMIAKDPMERFSSMEELQSTMERVGTVVLQDHIAKRNAERQQFEQKQAELQQAEQKKAAEDPERDRRGSGIRPAVRLTPSPAEAPQQPPTRVMVLEAVDDVMRDPHWETLRERGFQLHGRCKDPEHLAAAGSMPDLWVMGTSADRWRLSYKRWTQADVPPQKMLTCIDATVDPPDCAEAVKHISHVLIGPHPVEPMVLAAAMRWMQGRGTTAVETLISKRTVQLFQISSSALRSYYVESLVDDLRMNGVRRPVLRAIKELSEEMIMNALFHAPVGSSGWKNPTLDRGQPVALRPGQEALFRWAIGERYIVVSIRDPFGSLSSQDIFSSLAGVPSQHVAREGQRGAGLGLRIMARAANHVIFFIAPGRSCEVVALVEREPAAKRPYGRSLCVLQGWDHEVQQVGNSLWLREVEYPDATRIRLRGEIDETCDLSTIFQRSGTVYLDLSGVVGINSRGIHAWLEASRKRGADLELLLEHCSPAMVSQFNLLPDLAESGTIVSMMAPYYCPYCRRESNELLKPDEVEKGTPPARFCTVCSSELDFDDFAEEYFAFLPTE